jgi:hypothetical protein
MVWFSSVGGAVGRWTYAAKPEDAGEKDHDQTDDQAERHHLTHGTTSVLLWSAEHWVKRRGSIRARASSASTLCSTAPPISGPRSRSARWVTFVTVPLVFVSRAHDKRHHLTVQILARPAGAAPNENRTGVRTLALARLRDRGLLSPAIEKLPMVPRVASWVTAARATIRSHNDDSLGSAELWIGTARHAVLDQDPSAESGWYLEREGLLSAARAAEHGICECHGPSVSHAAHGPAPFICPSNKLVNHRGVVG